MGAVSFGIKWVAEKKASVNAITVFGKQDVHWVWCDTVGRGKKIRKKPKILIVGFCRRAVLVVLLVHFTTALISDRVRRVSTAAAVDRGAEQTIARRRTVVVTLVGRYHRHGGRRLSTATAAAAATDAAEQQDEHKSSTGTNQDQKGKSWDFALEILVTFALRNRGVINLSPRFSFTNMVHRVSVSLIFAISYAIQNSSVSAH